MSEEEIRSQRAALLLEMDDQKLLVANLQERDTRIREAFKDFLSSCVSPGKYPEVVGDKLKINHREYLLSDFDVIAAIERRKEAAAAVDRMNELNDRARQLGIGLK